MTYGVLAAVDLGASSGRVIAGRWSSSGLAIEEIHRFPNHPVRMHGTLYWDALALYRGVLDGLRTLRVSADRIETIGVDSWAVDYGLLDQDGALLGNPVHYRDERTTPVVPAALRQVPVEELYDTTGIQVQPFNTVFQLLSEGRGRLACAQTALLIPDLVNFWLTGELGTEITNASTTQLLDARTQDWARPLAERLGAPCELFPALRQPGVALGPLRPDVLDETGLGAGASVISVASHDTASAVVGVPAASEHFAYISCGTWALVGLELSAPVLTADSCAANFTNEIGADGTIRYLRNVTGLWLVQECLRTWRATADDVNVATVVADAAYVPALRSIIDVQEPALVPPGDMPARIRALCGRTGQPVPDSAAETVRCILDSLAVAFRISVREAARLAGRRVEVVHMVGGGSANRLLCQLTADACELPVVAGPVEAAAWGNVLVQARTAGVFDGGLAEGRELVRRAETLSTFSPRGDGWRWQQAEQRVLETQSAAQGPVAAWPPRIDIPQ
jgi:rhamnulokinase